MKGLRKTTLGGFGNEHYHIVYVNDGEGIALCAESDGHKHEIRYDAPQEAQTDEQGNVTSPATPGGFTVLPAVDGHTHDRIIPYRATKQTSGESDSEIISDVLALARNSWALEGECIDKGIEATEFVRGKQWEDGGKSDLERQGRSALTINFTARSVNELCGYEIQNRTDIRYLPQEDGDQRVADILNILVKQITNQCYFDREKSKTFRSAVVSGRGLFNCFMDFSRNLEGEIKIENYPFREFKAGPHEKEDLSDCEYIIKDKKFSVGKLKQLYPDKADEITSNFSQYQNFMFDTRSTGGHIDDAYNHGKPYPVYIDGLQLVDIARKEVLVIECWRKVYIEIPIAASPLYSCYENIFGWKSEDIDAIDTIDSFGVIKKPGTKMRISKVACGTVLQDDYCPDLPVDDFFIVPVYANKDGGYFWGKVEDVKDAQRGFNKRYSQSIDIVNRMASYGWFIDSNVFPDNEKDKFLRNSSTPGFVAEVNDISRTPVKIEGVKFPTELAQVMAMDEGHINKLFNISVAPRGANTSATALLQEQKIRLTGNEFLFDALQHAMVKLGRMILKMIQRFYTPERIARIVLKSASKKNPMIGGQPLNSYTEEDFIAVLETADLDQYDVEIAEAPNSPSAMLTTYTILSDLAQKGVQVPPEVLIGVADIPDEKKQSILQSITQQQDAMAAAEKEKYKGEMGKTLIAQGYIPPDVAQEFGLQIPTQEGPTDQSVETQTQAPLMEGVAEYRG